MTEETIDWKEGMPYKIGFSEGFIDGFNKGKSQAKKEILEVFDLWMRNSNLTFDPDVSYETDYARRINKYIEELKQQLKKLGEEWK